MTFGVALQGPLYAVCYDVTNNPERRRLDRLLKGYGFRVQKSVFECHLNDTQKQRLYEALGALSLTTGHVRVYRVYADSRAKTFGGVVTATPDDSFSYVL